MNDVTRMNSQEIGDFIEALEEFKANVEKHCIMLEDGIDECGRFMNDAPSKKALLKGKQICMNIRDCLHPTILLLERLYDLERELNNGFTL